MALDGRYEDALILKTFTFQAVNSYFALCYVSFVQSVECRLDPSCQPTRTLSK